MSCGGGPLRAAGFWQEPGFPLWKAELLFAFEKSAAKRPALTDKAKNAMIALVCYAIS